MMRCPKCKEQMKRTYTHHRASDKPNIYIESCADCSIQICWFEMKDGYTYKIDQVKDDETLEG